MQDVAIVSCDKEVLELAASLPGVRVHGFFDANAKAGIAEFSHLGSDDAWQRLKEKQSKLRVILALDPPAKKKKLITYFGQENCTGLISPAAVISPSAKLGAANIIQQGVRIMADARLGSFCKLNVEAIVHHDCQIGDFCTLAPRALLLGAVCLEDEVFVGAGAIILPKIRIGQGAVIGAGAVVTHDIPRGATVKGVPAK